MTRSKARMGTLRAEYLKKRPQIRARLEQFALVLKGKDENIFQELCFCLLTANANAVQCDKAIKDLRESGLLFTGAGSRIRPKLRGRVRFHNKKADFIVEARKVFKCPTGLDLKGRLAAHKNVVALRDWLVENIKGYGYKEASHFLRNIGLGKDIAILDRHILKNLKTYGVIDNIPASLGSKILYFDIEEKMRRFSRRLKIPMDEMDLLFWSMQTGFVFK